MQKDMSNKQSREELHRRNPNLKASIHRGRHLHRVRPLREALSLPRNKNHKPSKIPNQAHDVPLRGQLLQAAPPPSPSSRAGPRARRHKRHRQNHSSKNPRNETNAKFRHFRKAPNLERNS